MMIPRCVCLRRLLTVLALSVSSTAPLRAGETSRHLRFAPGQSSAAVQGAVIRGDRDEWSLRAREGQWLTVRLASRERNAVFSIYPPGGRAPLRGTEEGADAMRWSGRLSRSGEYRIRIGGTRGNARYVLRVTVR